MSNARIRAMEGWLRKREAAMHAPITDENMLGCIEELEELFVRRGIAADCTLVLPHLTVDFRIEGKREATDGRDPAHG